MAADLSIEERDALRPWDTLIAPYIVGHLGPLKLLYDGVHPLKELGQLLISFNSENVAGNKEHLIKEMYNSSLEYKTYIDEKKQIWGSKQGSNQHYDILLNLKLIQIFVKAGCFVNLDGKLPNGISEFIASKNKIDVHIEAKNISPAKLSHNVYEHPSNSSNNSLTTEQERDIRKQFKTILTKDAFEKFKGYNGLYIIAIGLHYNLGMLGEKIKSYIDNYTYFQNRKGLLALLINDTRERFIVYTNPNCSINLFKWLNIKPPNVPKENNNQLTILKVL